MRSRSPLSDLAERGQPFANDISSTLVAVKAASERGRAESIRDVVDAYRRLYGSVQRFVAMLTGERPNFAPVGTSGSHTLHQLLSILAEHAGAARFARLRELKAAINEARSADQLRDAIFSDALSNDVPALRKVVAELERLDAAFIGLCVGHVLEQHARTTGSEMHAPAVTVTVTAASRRAIARSTAPAAANPRKARAEPILVRSTD